MRSGAEDDKTTSSCLCWYVCQLLSHVQLFVTPWTIAFQALSSMGFSRQEYWSGLPFLLQRIHPGIKPWFSVLQTGSLPSKPPGKFIFTLNKSEYLMTQWLLTEIFARGRKKKKKESIISLSLRDQNVKALYCSL